MNYWIEVTTGMRWDRLLRNGVTLNAPNNTRYRNFFAGLKVGDLVLHYLTTSLTRQKERQSAAIGAFIIASDPIVASKRIVARCSSTVVFRKPVLYKELREVSKKSTELKGLLRVNMQRYITKISRSDFGQILAVYREKLEKVLKLSNRSTGWAVGSWLGRKTFKGMGLRG